MLRFILLAVGPALVLASSTCGGEMSSQLQVRVSWGHQSPASKPFHLQLLPHEIAVAHFAGQGLEADDVFQDGVWRTRAGQGDVDALVMTLRYAETPIQTITNLHRIWADLINQSDADTARRLRLDPAFRRDSRKLTIQMNPDGTQGFSVTVDQLLQNRTFWVPALDLFLDASDPEVSFAEHRRRLEARAGQRVLDQVEREPEATYEQFTARWEDMGNPAYRHPSQPVPGHIVGLTWDSAIPKFGIDRGAGVWNDYGNPDRFRFWFDFGDPIRGLTASWKSQRLADGLPVLTTVIETNGLRWEVEQLAFPLHGPPAERRGDLHMVLLQKLTATSLTGPAREVSVELNHRRETPAAAEFRVGSQPSRQTLLFEESAAQGLLLSVQGADFKVVSTRVEDTQPAAKDKKAAPSRTGIARLTFRLPENGSCELVVKLPSPLVPAAERERLLALDYAACRAATLKFWADYLTKGAQFRVPEKAVNDLFRANLWHALRLPRRHGGTAPDVRIDLPYSNFAYDQKGTPWPVNQAVYVDYMLYDLRGYHAESAEELRAIYRNNQAKNGHVGGFANWGVYTPSMIYAAAQNYLLSGDRALFDSLLPQTLQALDWCLAETQRSADRSDAARGLVRAPLNDGTGEGVWAFNQAYVYAGLELLGKALGHFGHPRAQECRDAARSFQQAVERGFGQATRLSPLVQLRDQTWMPYVPCEVLTPRRLLEQWYPTDVDTGALHLSRLKALPPNGPLTEFLLHDHEDNLFLKGWGMANEPVYNQQATAYLLRDDPKAVIRAFYSMLACAFSHSVFEPVEHRWNWGQYFGPPSTDGAWFELYRRMLIHELDDDTLLLLQAAPRRWLEDGQTIEVERAPTYYGKISFRVESQAASGKLRAEIEMPDRGRPQVLLLRLRHPEGRTIHSVTVNGRAWMDFDVRKEWVRIAQPDQRHYVVAAQY